MSPTLVAPNNLPIIALGAGSAPKIISQVVLELVCLLDLNMSPQQAHLPTSAFTTQWFLADELIVERNLAPDIRDSWPVRAATKIKEASSMELARL